MPRDLEGSGDGEYFEVGGVVMSLAITTSGNDTLSGSVLGGGVYLK